VLKKHFSFLLLHPHLSKGIPEIKLSKKFNFNDCYLFSVT
jgi:hypothetical protein